MDARTRMFASGILFGTVLLLAGCGYTQQSKFQMSFLPPATAALISEADAPDTPPVVSPPNPYLRELPVLLTKVQPPKHKLLGDSKVQKADQAFQRGRRAYQSNEIEVARREFDAAIDSMLDACDENPDDREDYEGHLDE